MVSVSNSSLFSSNFLTANTNSVTASLARLSAGNKITKASDDVAALAIGTALSTQVTTLRAALGNVTQASSLLQVANGGLSQQLDILERQKALAVQASSGGIDDTTRQALNQEFQGLSDELNRIAGGTNFNGVPLLNGATSTNTDLANTDAQSAAFQPTVASGSNASSAANSTKAVEAFNATTGASLNNTAVAGGLSVTDTSGAQLSNAAFQSINSSLAGGISDFTLSNVNYGVSATLTATVGGVQYSGTYTNGATTATLTNGNTSITIGTGTSAGAATALNISTPGSVASAEAGLNNVFSNTSIQRVQTVSGVDFTGTALAGVSGSGSLGIASARLNSDTAVISNFRYDSNNGTANSSSISVDINGQTFTATGVKDALSSGSTLVFQSADNQVFKVDLTGLATPFSNIRTNGAEQDNLISALNTGFAKAGGSLSFAAGNTGSAPINVSLGNTTTNALFSGQSLAISTQGTASTTSAALDQAINALTSAQANVGGLQAQLDSTADALTSAIQAQDSARSELLDTDIAAESTRLASSLVQQQASIATQAQVNKLKQGLLKLVQ